MFVWRCLKCFRYLTDISVEDLKSEITQRTLCPRCKSENKITLVNSGVVASCAFSLKYKSNLAKKKQVLFAVDTRLVLLPSIIPLSCDLVKIILIK